MMTFEARLVGIIFWVIISVFFAASGIYRKFPAKFRLEAQLERLFQKLEQKLNRPGRREYDIKLRGALVLGAMVVLVCVGGAVVYSILGWFGTRWPRIFLEASLFAIMVRPALVVQSAAEVSRLLVKGNLDGARQELKQVTDADVMQLDSTGVGRFTIESMARSLHGEAFAPVFWYFLGGFYFLLPYLVVRMLTRDDWVNSPERKAFLAVPLFLNRSLNLFPAIATAVVSSLTSNFVPGASQVKSFREITKSPDPDDIITAAYSDVFGLSLGGSRACGGVLVEKPWFGSGTAIASPTTINRAIMHYLVTFASILVIVGLAALIARA